MFRFNRVSAKNFCRFEKLDFDFRNRGIVLVEGLNEDNRKSSNSNGAGKSTIFESVVFSLYGRTLRGQKNDDVIMPGKKTCEMELDFEFQGNEYKIERKRGNAPSLGLWKNGEDITAMDIRATQSKIDEMIPYNLFSNAVFFSGSTFESFVQAADADKKEIMSSMFGLSLFDKAKEIASQKSKKIKNSLIQSESKLTYLKDDIEKLKEEKKALEIKLGELKSKGNLEEKKSELVQIQDAIEKNKEKMNFMRESVKDQRDKKDKLMELENKQSGNLRDLQNQKSNIERELSKINKLKDEGKCPTCGQEITGDYKGDEIGELETKLSSIDESVIHCNTNISKVKEAYSGIVEEIEKKEKRGHEIDREQMDQDEKSNVLARELNYIEKELSVIESSISKVGIDMENKKNEHIEVEKEIANLKEDFEIYEFWKEGFSPRGISNFVLELYLPRLNQLSNEYLSYLFDEDVSIRFLPYEELKTGKRRERWSVELGGSLNSYIDCSNGERRRIDLAIMLALNNILRSRLNGINLLVVDEAFDPLDERGVESVLSLLEEQIKDIESFFVVTQRHDFGERFEKSILVRKKGGVSTIA